MGFDVGGGNLTINPFYLDLSVWSGIFVMFSLISLAVFLFFKRMLWASGVLCWFIGILLMYNGINWLISMIPIFIGILLVFGGGKT